MSNGADRREQGFDGYATIETLATDATSLLVRARDERLRRVVLLRRLRPGIGGASSMAEGLRHQARLFAQMESVAHGFPDLLSIVDDPERVALVLRDRGGKSLAQCMGADPLLVAAAAAVVADLADAMHELHQKGWFHLGLRPEAVVLQPGGRPCIVDLHTARRASDAPQPEDAGLAPTAAAYRYAAPEQILAEPPSAATDIYALSTLFFELATGRHPFADDGDEPSVAQIRREPAVPLSRIRPEVSDDVEELIGSGLAKAPGDRPPDAARFARSLDAAFSASRTERRAAAAIAFGLPPEDEQAVEATLSTTSPPPARHDRKDQQQLIVHLALVSCFVVLGAFVFGRVAPENPSPISSYAEGRGFVRVLARPWAEVFIDGERIDVTPIGRPIPVSPGKHYVVFRHPKAVDQEREIQIANDQVVTLDVVMEIPQAVEAAPSATVDPDLDP